MELFSKGRYAVYTIITQCSIKLGSSYVRIGVLLFCIRNLKAVGSVTRFGDLLDFGQLFKALGPN